MNLDFRYIIKVTGIVLVVMSLAMLPPFFVSLIYNEFLERDIFIIAILLSGVLGLSAVWSFKPAKRNLNISDGFIIISISWLIASVVAAIPLYMSGWFPSVIDAFFESCSGLSTTGCSILTDVEHLPKSILFWRSFTHWLGGLGFLRFAIVLMPTIGISGHNVFSSETPGLVLDDLIPKMIDTTKIIAGVYIMLTILETILLILGDMNLFDSLIHTFGTVGTGGFSNYNDSIAHFDSVYIKIIITIFMAVSGMNYNLFFLARKKGIRTILRDTEFRFYLLFLAASSILIFAGAMFLQEGAKASSTLTDAAFEATSILTTTGYMSYDYTQWPMVCQMLILILMFIGGCSFSTSGGIKVIRIVILLKLMRRGIRSRLHPHVVNTPKLYDKNLPPDAVSAVASHIFLYILMVFIGVFLISFDNQDLTTTFTSVITCLGNVGPGFAGVGPVENFAFFSGFSKFVLSILMIAGRLELFALFIIFTPYFWRKNK